MNGEEPLSGGRTTAGVVRIGQTVRRPVGNDFGLIPALLAYLAEHRFDAAPRFLGFDEEGRMKLSYIDGVVPSDLDIHDDATLCAAARLIRRYHDATAGFAAASETICHNDLSPFNFVFVDDLPIALIDFDAAAPGTRLWDLGYAAWMWLDIGDQDLSPSEQLRRLELFAHAYDPELAFRDLIPTILDRQRLLAAEAGDRARQSWASDCLDWTIENIAA